MKKPNLESIAEEFVTKSIGASAFIAIYIQENLRMAMRRGHWDIPVSKPIQEFFYQHFGNFGDGYLLSLMANMGLQACVYLANNLSEKSGLKSAAKITEKIVDNPHLIDSLSIIIGAGVVYYSEANSIMNTGEMKDIPSGVLGALTYFGARKILKHSFEKARKKDRDITGL